MPRESETIKHITLKAETDHNYNPQNRSFHLYSNKINLSYKEFASLISKESRAINNDYFIDTNFFTRHEVDPSVWDALLQNRITITRGVWEELLPWRTNPFYNRHLSRDLNAAKENGSSTILFDEDVNWGIPCGVFRDWYANVLAQRKRKAQALVTQFVKAQRRDPSPEEFNNLFQKGGTDRDFHIFRKGQREIAAGTSVFTDEELVAAAAMVTLVAQRNTTILTRDHDVLEQFYKLTGLLTIHYQSMLFAKRLLTEGEQFQRHPMPQSAELQAYFDLPESQLIKKPVPPDQFLTWLLPREFEPLQMRCLLFTGEPDSLKCTPIIYICESSMHELVLAKGNSWGLNTDLLDGKNCHVTGFPIGILEPRSFAIVAQDRLLQAPKTRFKFPLLDLAHATTHFETLKLI